MIGTLPNAGGGWTRGGPCLPEPDQLGRQFLALWDGALSDAFIEGGAAPIARTRIEFRLVRADPRKALADKDDLDAETVEGIRTAQHNLDRRSGSRAA